ncbi:ABC-type dipeptide transport periplasmic component [Fusarium oxysporum f. sp. phaseoli]
MSDLLRVVLENVDFRLPTQVTDDNSVLALKSLVLEPLIQWQPSGEVLPGLFARWDVSDDQRTWFFHIRDGAVFHDGKTCDAPLIVEYIKGFLDSHDYFGMAWSYSRYFANTTFTAEDAKVVKIQHQEPFPDLLNVLNDFWPSRIDGNGKPILGTGPYRVVDFQRQDDIGSATLELVDPAQHPAWSRKIVATAARSGEERLKLLQSGQPLRLRTPEWMPEHAIKITEFVKRSLEAIGFKVDVEFETNRPEYARSIGLRKNIGDLACFDSTPNTTFRVLDDKVSSESHGTWWLGYHDDGFQRLFAKARIAAKGDDRNKAYAEALKRVHENPPWLYIAHPDVIWATKPGVKLSIGPSVVLELGK